MYIRDITIQCGQDDPASLRKSEQERLQLVLRNKESDEWGLITLERQNECEWSAWKGYLNIDDALLSVTVLAESCNGIAHALYERCSVPSSGNREIALDIEDKRIALTLRWTVSQEEPVSGVGSSEVMTYDKLGGYAFYYRRTFESTEDATLLAGVIDAWTKAVGVAVVSYERVDALKWLASALYDQFNYTGDAEAISRAISEVQDAISLTEESDPNLAFLLTDLGLYQRTKFCIHLDIPDIEASISSLRRACVIAESSAPITLGQCLYELSTSLGKAYQFTDRISYLQEALESGTRGVELTVEDHPMLPRRIFDLGNHFDSRFEQGQVLADSNKAIDLMQRAIELVESRGDTGSLVGMLVTLARVFKDRFVRTNDVSHVQQSVEAFRRAADLASVHDLPDILNHLGVVLDFAFYLTENPEQIEEAIFVLRRSVSLTDVGDPSLPSRLRNLAVALESDFSRTEDLKTIQEAISCYQRALEATPKNNSLLSLRLNDLSKALASRASFTGETLDMDEAINIRRKEVEELDVTAIRLPKALHDLGLILVRRAASGGNISHIREAIAAYQRAIDILPPGHRDIPFLYNDLGNAHQKAFMGAGDIEDINAAIDMKRKAVSLLPNGHARLPIFLINLGISLKKRFEKDGRLQTIEEAIDYQERATQLVPNGHGGLPVWYTQLAHSLDIKFQKTKDVADINKAIETMKKGLMLLPTNHISIPERTYILANYTMKRSRLSDGVNDVHEAVGHYRTAALCTHGYTSIRLKAAQKWAEHARSFDIDSSMEAYERAIDLVSVFVGLEQTQGRRHENIAQISDLSRSAAATAFEAGKAEKAIDWLERGRCLVWGQLNSLRTPLDDLRLADERLAERVLTVSKALEDADSHVGKKGVVTDKTSVDMALEWKDLVSSIRRISGFEDFLKTRSFTMNELPPHGTLVVINAHSSRCDAVALRLGWQGPVHIPLPNLSMAKAVRMVEQLKGHLDMGGVRSRGYDGKGDDEDRGLRRMQKGAPKFKLIDLLRDLWTSVVEPIFQTIGYLENESPQHVWWCPTGALAFLPLHAAGAYRGGPDTASDFAISSYTPNINTLLKQINAKRTSTELPSGILAISQPNTPGHTPLPGTTREIEAVGKVFHNYGINHTHLEGEKATRDYCVEMLAEHSCVHFACHAFQDPKEPLESGFFLHDGRLELATIIRNNLKNAELAFLSACQTSTGDEKLAEEAVHLAAGMVAAGYPSVVATMWSIKDRYAPEVASQFYSELLRLSESSAEERIDGARSAEALHFAVGHLRGILGDTEDALLTWVPYVHFGV